MNKNSQLFLRLETKLKEKLKQEAQDQNISFSELCRQKFRVSSKLIRIEEMLEELLSRKCA
jgi:hypothetical protein